MKKKIIIDENISLVPYYKNYEVTLNWYLDKDVCKQCDNIDHVYDLDRLDAMYTYLDKNGDLYYICYQDNLVGDVSIQNDGTIGIVVSKEYQNMHIGRKVIEQIKKLAYKKGLPYVHAEIYSFNKQSEKAFLKCGFIKEREENYYYRFNYDIFINDLKNEVLKNDLIELCLLVGSYARNEQKADSDVDIVLVCNDKEKMLNSDFFYKFSNVVKINKEIYGDCTSIRVYYSNGLEIEFGVVALSWILKPIPTTTLNILNAGYKVIASKKDYLS